MSAFRSSVDDCTITGSVGDLVCPIGNGASSGSMITSAFMSFSSTATSVTDFFAVDGGEEAVLEAGGRHCPGFGVSFSKSSSGTEIWRITGLTGFFVIALMLSLLIFVGEAVRDAFDPRKAFQ